MNPVTGLSLGRIAIGVASLARPDETARLMQLDPTGNPQLPFVVRLFGAREVAVGALTLVSTGRARTGLVLAGVAIDAADAAASYVTGKGHTVPPAATTLMMGVASGAVLGGLLGLRVKKKVELVAS